MCTSDFSFIPQWKKKSTVNPYDLISNHAKLKGKQLWNKAKFKLIQKCRRNDYSTRNCHIWKNPKCPNAGTSNCFHLYSIIAAFMHFLSLIQMLLTSHCLQRHNAGFCNVLSHYTHTFILRSNVGSYWIIMPNNDVHISNGLQDTRQNHWTIKYRSQWPTFILRSNLGSYWFIIPKYDVQDILWTGWRILTKYAWI